MQYVFDFNEISTVSEFYDSFEEKLDLPSFFGRNLDALYDVISGDLPLPLEIEFINLDLLQLEEFQEIIDVFTDAAETIEGFSFVSRIRPHYGFEDSEPLQ